MLKAVQIRKIIKKEFPNLSFSEFQIKQIDLFLGLLAEWNQKFNLTSIRESDTMLTKHVLDSLALYLADLKSLPTPPLSGKIMDMGSGAGLPGIILSIYDPSLNIYSLDKSKKKISFQEHIKSELDLERFFPQTANMNSMTDFAGYRQSYNCILVRAFSQIKTIVGYAGKFLAPGGYLILWKGKNWQKEMEELPEKEKKEFQLCLSQPYQFGDGTFGGTILVFRLKE